MPDKIIKTIELPSGCTAIAFEASPDTLAVEVSTGVIFLSEKDIPVFVQLLQTADKHFLRK